MTLLTGHVIDVLRTLEAESVNCVVTSPPYWLLRKYDAPDVVWGGDPDCPHTLESGSVQPNTAGKRLLPHGDGRERDSYANERMPHPVGGYTGKARWQHDGVSRQETPDAWVTERVYNDSPVRDGNEGVGFHDTERTKAQRWRDTSTCSRCGAWRGQYGLEPTPELYIEHTVAILHEIRRVLRADGVVWWNIGGGYAGGGQGTGGKQQYLKDAESGPRITRSRGLKPKDMDLIAERVALAAQADGWWVRSRVIWWKPNAMPESAKDRPTDDHEIIWMLTKSGRYWSDFDAVREPHHPDGRQVTTAPIGPGSHESQQSLNGHERWPGEGRNIRTVWRMNTASTPEAHFATFPIELPTKCIMATCPKGGLVLDPFSGLATTGIAALRLGRRFVGIELSEKYAEMARKKLSLWWQDAKIVEADVPDAQMALDLAPAHTDAGGR